MFGPVHFQSLGKRFFKRIPRTELQDALVNTETTLGMEKKEKIKGKVVV